MKKANRKAVRPGRVLLYGVLTLLGVVWVYPFLWMLASSFKSNKEIIASGLSLLPQSFSFDNVVRAWNQAQFDVYFYNTVIVTVAVALIVAVMTCMAGYVMGRFHFPGRKILMLAFVASITIPAVSTIIPVYELVNAMGLVGTKTGLILAHCGGSHVVFIMLFSSFFRQIPNEMMEAAEMDGCGFVRTFVSVMAPLAKPMLTTTIIMESIWTWNSFLLPLVLTLNAPSARMLAVGLYAFRGENVIDWAAIAAGGMIAVVPIIVLFVLMQRYFVDGIAGAVKS